MEEFLADGVAVLQLKKNKKNKSISPVCSTRFAFFSNESFAVLQDSRQARDDSTKICTPLRRVAIAVSLDNGSG